MIEFFDRPPYGEMSLMYLHDSGVPFDLIADIVEAEPYGLFDVS